MVPLLLYLGCVLVTIRLALMKMHSWRRSCPAKDAHAAPCPASYCQDLPHCLWTPADSTAAALRPASCPRLLFIVPLLWKTSLNRQFCMTAEKEHQAGSATNMSQGQAAHPKFGKAAHKSLLLGLIPCLGVPPIGGSVRKGKHIRGMHSFRRALPGAGFCCSSPWVTLNSGKQLSQNRTLHRGSGSPASCAVYSIL